MTGVVAEEILAACDELGVGGGSGLGGGDGGQTGLANPAIHLLRGLRHRNLAAIRHAAQVKGGKRKDYAGERSFWPMATD